MRTLLALIVLSIALSTALSAQESWEERAWVALNKKVAAEFVDTKLSVAMSFIANYTNLTIIMDPKIAKTDPLVNLKVTDMDAGTVIRWLTKLTETYAEVKDQAIFITDKPSEEAAEQEKDELLIMAAVRHVELDIPPKGVPLTDADRVKIALKLMEVEAYKPTDFPGPELGIGIGDPKQQTNPFGVTK